MNLKDDIQRLKKDRRAIILAHYYQPLEIQEVADFIGDSLALAQQASKTDANMIVFAGVYFMAETAKLLNPDKTVLIPSLLARCEMADMVSAHEVRALKEQYPGVPVVAYVNTTAEVKSESDICCTSRNVIPIVNGLNSDRVIYVPDRNMARYIQSQTGKEIIYPNGFCYVHDGIDPKWVEAEKRSHIGAVVLAHPECPPEVLAYADVIASTAGMIRHVEQSASNSEFIVLTEDGLAQSLRADFPDRQFYSPESVCRGMKATTLHDLYRALEFRIHEIDLNSSIAPRARATIDNMLRV
ncbi:MAG: quinolinate synthase NadA [Nanoarchaeota archaeon]